MFTGGGKARNGGGPLSGAFRALARTPPHRSVAGVLGDTETVVAIDCGVNA